MPHRLRIRRAVRFGGASALLYFAGISALAWVSKAPAGIPRLYADVLRLDALAARVLPLTGRSILTGLIPLLVLGFLAGAFGPSATRAPQRLVGRSQ